MSTQHPDNVQLPSWVEEEIIAGEAEVHETYFAYNELKCEEQMWDWEGKDVDPNIVRKLLVNHPDFFKEHILGKDVFLTYRVPNPNVEKTEKKILIEALESIPRCYDVAKSFYKKETRPPLFEVILPFTTSHFELLRVASCYSKVIVGKEKMKICDAEDMSMEDWVGGFEPKKIEVIPLVEDKEGLSNIDKILVNFAKHLKPNYLRVFLARSDPALNYGLFSAVLLIKLALSKICRITQDLDIQMFPIIGTGSLPFRGHLTPRNINDFLQEYAGIRTVTIQSALKYDFNREETKKTIEKLNMELQKRNAKRMTKEQQERMKNIIELFAASYQQKIEKLSTVINFIAKSVPDRRARKLHIGLFGYSREVEKTKLPRAIKFTAAMYSLGLPPELIGAGALANLSEEDWELPNEYYKNWKKDLEFASGFLCWQNLNNLMSEREIIEKVTSRFKLGEVIPMVIEDLQMLEENTGIVLGPKNLDQRKHENMVNNILISLAKADFEEATRYILEAGRIRHSLG